MKAKGAGDQDARIRGAARRAEIFHCKPQQAPAAPCACWGVHARMR